MKVLLFSDLHGSIESANSILLKVGLLNPDLVLFLGDYFSYGYSNEVSSLELANILNRIPGTVYGVKGNGDSRTNLSNLHFPIEQLLFSYDNDSLSLYGTHGDRYTHSDLPSLRAGAIFATGHTHVPHLKKRGSLLLVNPGSVSRPRSNDGACYGEINDNKICIKKFNSDKIISSLDRF